MQRQWNDPRDAESWLVTVTPFGWRANDRAVNGGGSVDGGGGNRGNGARQGEGTVTVSFHRPGTPPVWTRYSAERPISGASDQDLMDFLDEARRLEERGRAETRQSARTDGERVMQAS